MAYSIYTEYKKRKTGLINIEFKPDGSAYFTDLIGRYFKDPEYSFFTYDFPSGKVGTGRRIKPDPIVYVTTGKPKFSYHPRKKFFQVSGDGMRSGFYQETDEPKGLAVKTFDFNVPENDGGPIVTGKFWGLNHLQYKPSKTSDEILFDEEKIRYQSWINKGDTLNFNVLIFQIAEGKIRPDPKNENWGYYDYINCRKPVWVRILKNPYQENYVLAVSVLIGWSYTDSETGFNLTGGSTLIDPKTGTCKSVSLFFPRLRISNKFSEVSLDYQKEA